MPSYPNHIARCQHIKVNGTQCGSPSLRETKFCYFHVRYHWPELETLENKNEFSSFMRQTLEDANSIQIALANVIERLTMQEIDHKAAALTLYALQIASANLKHTSPEPELPTQVVIDRKSVAQRPLGATAWSKLEGRDYDDLNEDEAAQEEEEEGEAQQALAPPPTAEELYKGMLLEDRIRFREKWAEQGFIDPQELSDYMLHGGHDPFLLTMRRMCAERDRKLREEARKMQSGGGPPAPGGSIQACRARGRE